MRKINCKSDFDFILRLTDCKGDPVGFPPYDWSARLWTKFKADAVTVSCIGGKTTNCFNDNGEIHVVCNSHGLAPGVLRIELAVEIPDGIYPDGARRMVSALPLGIELVRDNTPCPVAADVELTLPYIKVDPFTFEDFTPDQIEDLKRPATEAAARLDSFVSDAKQAESGREDSEKKRVSAERERAAQERSRMDAENTRNADEEKRRNAESLRKTAEESRKTAETNRANTFNSWKTDIDAAQMRLFCDLLNAAAGKKCAKITADGKFKCVINGLELTYDEALEIYRYGAMTTDSSLLLKYYGANIRTNLPSALKYSAKQGERTFLYSKMEVIDATLLYPDSACFNACYNLREVTAIYAPNNSRPIGNNDAWSGCFKLESIKGIHRVFPTSFSFVDSPLLNIDTLSRIVKVYTDSTPITITVHPDVYSKITDPDNAEWHPLLAQAEAKSISFATA